MARGCGCGGNSCACLVIAGDGIQVTGTGTAANPYIVRNVASDLAHSFAVNDTTTLDLSLSGAGTNIDPFVLSGVVKLRLNQLSDVADPDGPTPVAGQTLVWVGSGSAGHWEYQTPSSGGGSGGPVTADQITDAGATGKSVLRAADATSAKTALSLSKADVGLGNVTNTADSAKTFSTSQITSGVFPASRLGTGTLTSATVLYGDGVFRTAPTGGSGGTSSGVVVRRYTNGSYPVRGTVASDGVVFWIGPTAPTVGGNYAVADTDIYMATVS